MTTVDKASRPLGDYTITPRVLVISLIAVVIGFLCSYVAWALLQLIGIATNLFFYGRWSTTLATPADHHLGIWVVCIPVLGGLIIGVMARYGSDRIRGHGIPEAIESILLRGAKVDPKVAVLKPVSAAISIGSGGPFGAEGPIIMTGGAIGSLIAQFFHLTDSERKTLLVAGSAAGMSATFAAPIASVFLAFELLLFEFKPRSVIPVALASTVAAAARVHLLGMGPIFPRVEHHAMQFSTHVLIGCFVLGILTALLAMGMTRAVYASEDAFEHLPIHWMWWPAIGGLIIGIGGLIFPHGLGVGYDLIAALLTGSLTLKIILGILFVKSLMWALSLGSGTSGGVLAPLLMVGAALGAAAALLLPGIFPPEGLGFWPMLSMAAMLASTLGAPFTAIIFAIELTSDVTMLLPLLLTVIVAYTLNVLVMQRSILTEKISRRGFHLSREYAVDPLEIMFVREVMRTGIVALPESMDLTALRESLASTHGRSGQWLYPVVRADQSIAGVFTRNELLQLSTEAESRIGTSLAHLCACRPAVVTAYPDEPLRVIVYRMAQSGLTRLPVVDRRSGQERFGPGQRESNAMPKLVGIVSLQDLLKARVANLQAEHKRERILPLRIFWPERFKRVSP